MAIARQQERFLVLMACLLSAASLPVQVNAAVSDTADVTPTNIAPVNDESRIKAYQIGRSGTELFKSGQYEAACEKFKEALQIDPAETNSRINLTMSLFRLGKTADALAVLDSAIPPADNNATYWFNVGVTYGMLGSFPKALKNLNYFVEHFPRDDRVKEAAGLVESFTKANSAGQTNNAASSDDDRNYFAVSCKDGTTRWTDKSMPLPVYISSERKLKGFNPEFADIVKGAFEDWSTASGGIVSFKFVHSPKDALINVTWTDNPAMLANPAEAGHCKVSGNEKGSSTADIILLIVNRLDGSVVPPAKLRYTASHEIGHALGIAGHSLNARDVMFLGAIDNNFPAKISDRDIATLKKIYETPPDQLFSMSQQNAWVSAANKGVAAINSRNASGAIALLEESLSLAPSDKKDYVKGLMGLAYYNHAVALINRKELDEARQMLDKANEYLQFSEDKKTQARAKQAYKLIDAAESAPAGGVQFRR